ncbi:DNA polymerase III subunit gamma/tau [Candidatus Dojkabacteria bacterium]|nr:DNA polymerase III subunit gamma/tau [Candidatus Dojkabacteria bacterium]
MPITLYQKYRPGRFDEIVGQDWISKVLKKALKDGKHSHAYLFSGARGTGKTSTARIVAKALNCLNLKDGEPCNKCTVCKAVNEGRFLDIFEIDAASNRGIDEIRELKERVNFAPAEGRNKVYIIDETHMLTTEAFNALLKTLEEPPQHAVFILATTEPHKIPLTIISRTQRFDFKLANDEDLKKRIQLILKKEGVKMDEGAVDIIINGGGGSFRDAETILEKVIRSAESLKNRSITLDEVRQILGLTDERAVQSMMKSLVLCDLDSAFSVLYEINSQGLSLIQFLKQLLEFGRVLIHNKIESKKNAIGIDFDLKDLVKMIRILSECAVQMKAATIQILPLELAIVDICGYKKDNPGIQKGEGKAPFRINTTEKKAAIEEFSIKKNSSVTEETSRKKEKDKNITVSKQEQEQEQEQSESISEGKSDEHPVAEIKKIKKMWDKFLEEIKPHNNHLQAFLLKAEPSEIKGDKIILKVPFKFHKSRIEEHASRKVISEVFKALINVSLVPSCIIEEGLRSEIAEEEKDTDNADLVEEVFGDMLEEQ